MVIVLDFRSEGRCFDAWGPFLETPDNFPGPGEYFFELIYLSANGNYKRKLSDMLYEITKIRS